MTPFTLGRILYEARVRAAWGAYADQRLESQPFPRHEAEDMTEMCWLAIQEAKALLATYDVTPKAAP